MSSVKAEVQNNSPYRQ